jgi:hypothetical protein
MRVFCVTDWSELISSILTGHAAFAPWDNRALTAGVLMT